MVDLNIKLLSFDLDNTLYDNTDVIKTAERESKRYLQSEFLSRNLEFDYQDFEKTKHQLILNGIQEPNKHRIENLSYLRHQANLIFCSALPNPQLVAEKALNIFLNYRSKIQVSDCMLSMLERLKEQYLIVSVTNGNCDPFKTKLALSIERNYSPIDGLRAKPHPEMLLKIVDDFKLDKKQVLHIGDRLDADQTAAEDAGCQFHLFAPYQANTNESKECKCLLEKLLK